MHNFPKLEQKNLQYICMLVSSGLLLMWFNVMFNETQVKYDTICPHGKTELMVRNKFKSIANKIFTLKSAHSLSQFY